MSLNSLRNDRSLDFFDLDVLLSGAARLRPDRDALADDRGETLDFGELDRRVTALAQAFAGLGLASSERLVLVAGADGMSIVGLLAALRAGLDVALAPLHWKADALADYAGLVGAVALAAPSSYGPVNPADGLFAAAAQAPMVRLVCAIGSREVDSAVSLDPAMLDVEEQPLNRAAGSVLTRDGDGRIVRHSQRALVAAALDLVTRARLGMRLPIVTTIAPVTFAGLAAGPVASLLAGAPLVLHGPFDSRAFRAVLRRNAKAHLIVPGALAPMLERGGLVDADSLSTLLLLHRRQELDGEQPARLIDPALPVCDLYAIGENALAAEMRENDGEPVEPVAKPHYITLDDRSATALARSTEHAGGLEGVALSRDLI